MLYNQEDEEYKKRLEEARKLRQSAGMVTDAEKNNKFVYDDEYQNKLNEARKLRESVGMVTNKEIELSEIEEEPNLDHLNNDENNKENLDINNNINARGGNKISGLPTPIGVSNRKTVEDTQTKTTLADRQEQLKTIKSNYDDTIQNSNGLKELPKTAGMTARENVKKGENILPSNENTIAVNNEEVNDNIIQDIPGLLQNTWRGGVNGARRSLNYFINANEVISPVYKEQTLNQFLASPGVSNLEKWQYLNFL